MKNTERLSSAPAAPWRQHHALWPPAAGFYRMHMVRGGHPVGIHIWFGQPLDPVTRQPLDRSLRWQATANGRDIDLERVWPQCLRDPIDRAEHDYLASLQDWAERNAPDSPQADSRRRIDPLTAPTPF